MIDYDGELQLHNEQLRAAYHIHPADRVLDVGCGAGQTTRDAARMASEGSVLGVDIDVEMIALAKERADSKGVRNIQFEVGDAQVFPFKPAEFDVAISRFGTMFFSDPDAAFENVAQAIRTGGRLVMMVWQPHDRNEWATAIDLAVTGEPRASALAGSGDTFSLADPGTVETLLTRAGFNNVQFSEVDTPVYYGQNVTAALAFVSRFAVVSEVLQRDDARSANSAKARLRETIAAHSSKKGVWFDSRAWIVQATRR
jgi:ubiquinone/menaquinone biosynthesis C-methylase UbiE